MHLVQRKRMLRMNGCVAVEGFDFKNVFRDDLASLIGKNMPAVTGNCKDRVASCVAEIWAAKSECVTSRRKRQPKLGRVSIGLSKQHSRYTWLREMNSVDET